ncbi:TonB-dependent receptor [Cesiribacter sp. SM1]|uniref:SusC/RagA family TonB-linked outer membrane protein n=1 Tax=Cesiribacter sp. SM1 TaxID=2861196 RepID=UPI001CD25909|nr:TonB-dependent receptor [Cesiribacter sp. SM1]
MPVVAEAIPGTIKKEVAQQAQVIRGVITDEKGVPLPGATVVVVGTSVGTVSDANGEFMLSVPDGSTSLSVSFIGYQKVEVNIENQTNLNISLSPDLEQLDELVVVGYGAQSRKEITGAVSSVNPGEISSLPTASVEKMLDGRVPGVQVLSDNSPGGGVTLRVRGFGTINNNDPLYVIDGVPVTSGLNVINPADIETLQVLKDAASASIYGSRAANGVVVITTKKGNSDRTVFNVNAYAGVQQAFNLPRMLNAQQYGDMLWQAARNDGGIPGNDIYGTDPAGAVIPAWLNDEQTIPGSDVDWVKEIFRPAAVQSYDIAISKGDEKASHALSLGYFNEEGTIKYTGFERFSARFNSSYKIRDIITVGENFTASLTRTVDVGTNSSLGSIVYNAFQFPSIVPVRDINGNYAGNPLNDIANPLGTLDRAKDNVKKRLSALGNIYAGVELGDLEFKTNLGLDYQNYSYRGFSPVYDEILSQNNVNSLSTNNSFNYQLTWSNTLNYQRKFGRHNLDALLGQEAIQYYYEGFSASRQNFLYEDLNFRYLTYGADNQLNTGSASQWSLLSYFGRINYNFDQKYLLGLTLRRDGTSRLSENKWGTFPAVSAGWRISDEAFFNTGSFLSSLMLRASWGQTGNQQVPSYSTVDSYYNNARYSDYAIGGGQGSVSQGLIQTRVPNTDLAWEVTQQSNVGIDLGLFDHMLAFTADFYHKVTDDVLVYSPIPPTYGGTNDGTWINGGQMKNTGLEVALNYIGKAGELDYTLGLNAATYRNRLTELNGISYLGIPTSSLHSVNFGQEITRSTVDQPIGSFFGYQADGIFKNAEEVAAYGMQPNAQPGDLKFRDVNGDGVLNGDDRTFIGSPHPDLTMGLNVDLHYKGFDLSMFFNGSLGNDIYNLTKYKTEFFNQASYNKSAAVLGAWTPENPDATIPRVTLDDPNNNIRPSSYYLEDGSYFKLNNMQLGYNIPEGSIGGMNIRVYLQASNLFTITNYSGMTPEIGLQNYSSSNRNLDIGVDRGIYPPARTFVLGANVKL